MSRPRRKSFWRWEPLPYLIIVVLLLITGTLRPDAMPVAFWIVAVVTVAVIVAFAVQLIVEARRPAPNPDSSGDLSTLDGLTLLDAAPTSDRPVAVVDDHRHQSALDATQARAAATGDAIMAVLVPGASRWLAFRLRVSVQLTVGAHIHHAGFLPDAETERWQDELALLREHGVYVRVPAAVMGATRPFAATVDLGGLSAVIHSAEAQQSSS